MLIIFLLTGSAQVLDLYIFVISWKNPYQESSIEVISLIVMDGLSRGCAKTQFNIFYVKLNEVFFDPSRWWSLEDTPFLEYSTKLGWRWITTHEYLKKPIPKNSRMNPSFNLP